MTDDLQLATPEQARSAIETAIVTRLGEEWQQDWLVAHDAPFLVRLNKGDVNLDFQADLLGEVEVIEREANVLQMSGRFIAWMVLGSSLFIALAIAVAAGVLG